MKKALNTLIFASKVNLVLVLLVSFGVLLPKLNSPNSSSLRSDSLASTFDAVNANVKNSVQMSVPLESAPVLPENITYGSNLLDKLPDTRKRLPSSDEVVHPINPPIYSDTGVRCFVEGAVVLRHTVKQICRGGYWQIANRKLPLDEVIKPVNPIKNPLADSQPPKMPTRIDRINCKEGYIPDDTGEKCIQDSLDICNLYKRDRIKYDGGYVYRCDGSNWKKIDECAPDAVRINGVCMMLKSIEPVVTPYFEPRPGTQPPVMPTQKPQPDLVCSEFNVGETRPGPNGTLEICTRKNLLWEAIPYVCQMGYVWKKNACLPLNVKDLNAIRQNRLQAIRNKNISGTNNFVQNSTLNTNNGLCQIGAEIEVNGEIRKCEDGRNYKFVRCADRYVLSGKICVIDGVQQFNSKPSVYLCGEGYTDLGCIRRGFRMCTRNNSDNLTSVLPSTKVVRDIKCNPNLI